MAKNQMVAFAQSKLDDARRVLHEAVDDFSVPDEKLLEMRQDAKRAFDELKDLDRQQAKKGLLGLLGL